MRLELTDTNVKRTFLVCVSIHVVIFKRNIKMFNAILHFWTNIFFLVDRVWQETSEEEIMFKDE